MEKCASVFVLLLVVYIPSCQGLCNVFPSSLTISPIVEDSNCVDEGTYSNCSTFPELVKVTGNTALTFLFEGIELRRIIMSYQPLVQGNTEPQIYIEYDNLTQSYTLSPSGSLSVDAMENNVTAITIRIVFGDSESNTVQLEITNVEFFNCDPETVSSKKEEEPSTTTNLQTTITAHSQPTSGHTSTIAINTGFSLATALTGVGASIGILLLILSGAICILAIALVFNKRNKKSVPWSPNQNRPVPDTPVSGNYQRPPLDQYNGQMSDNYNSSSSRPGDICNGSFQLLSAASVPSVPPPSDSGLISIDEWRRKVEMEQMENEADMNPLYAGSMCGSEYGEPPQYETVSEAKKAHKRKEVNMLRLAQLRQASLTQGRVMPMERSDEIESGLTGSKPNIAGELLTQAALPAQAQVSRDFEADGSDNSEGEDEGDVSNCFYEVTGFQADRSDEQGNINCGSIYELDEDTEVNGQHSDRDGSSITGPTPMNREYNGPNKEDGNSEAVAREDNSSSQSPSSSSSNISSASTSQITTVLTTDGQECEPNKESETQSMYGGDGPCAATEEIPYDESVYDDPSCLDTRTSKSSVSN